MKFRAVGSGLIGALILALPLSSPGAAMGSQDKTFAVKAAQAGMTEVTLAAMAMQKSTSPNVLSFAHEMNADHRKANAQLASIITSEGMTPPSSVGAKNAALIGKLQAISGPAFDAMYLKSQLPAHRKVLAMFQKEASSGSDSALVSFAKATIPVIQSHISMDRSDIAKVASSGMSMPAMK